MIIFETTVVSELMRFEPEECVKAWTATLDLKDVYVTTTTEAELRFGVAVLPRGRKRRFLSDAMEELLEVDFFGRILPFDRRAAKAYAEIAAARKRTGRVVSFADGQISAIARVNNAIVATRNVKHFSDCGVEIINPWDKT